MVRQLGGEAERGGLAGPGGGAAARPGSKCAVRSRQRPGQLRPGAGLAPAEGSIGRTGQPTPRCVYLWLDGDYALRISKMHRMVKLTKYA
jgi:hypothetical protein